MAVSNKVCDFGEQLYDLSLEKGWEVGPGRKHGKVEKSGDGQSKALNDSMNATVNNLKNCLTNIASSNGLKAPASKEDFVNIFKLIFQYMQSDMKMNSQVELNQGLNMIVQSNLLDSIMKETSEGLTDMEKKFDTEESKLTGPLGMFMSVGLPIILAVAGTLTGGFGASQASAAIRAGSALAGSALTALAAAPASIYGNLIMPQMQEQGEVSQAKMSLSSSASDAANNVVKQDMQGEQNSQSNLQADLSMMQQELQQMVQSFGMGH